MICYTLLLRITDAVSFIVFMGYVVWWLKQWRRMFYAPEFNRLPQPVRNTLRRAILNGFYKPDDKAAYKFFQQALRECQELKMDPFSDEVLGIRITVLGWLERIQNYPSAAIVVEGILSDLNQWIANLEQCEKEGKIDETGHLRKSEPLALEGTPHPASQDFPPAQVSPPPPTTTAEPPRETLWHKRQRLLSKAISAAVKLGELYASEHMMETEKAHKHLRWAVETQLKEFQRRRTEGLKPGEEDTFMSPGEVGGSMESLGRDYERQGHFQYAITLFFQSLQLCDSPCHRPVIMNNLAAAFAQQPLLVSTPATVMDALENISSMPMPSTRKECLDAALNWVNNAYTHANDVKGSDRTPECDQACAVALCNWGDIAALMGKRDVAYKKYKQCIELSQKLNFTEGVTQAEEGMFKLDKQPLEQTSSP